MRPARDVSSLPLTLSRVQKESRSDDVVPTAWNHGARAASQCCQHSGKVLSFALVMRYFGSLTVWNKFLPWATDTLDMITGVIAAMRLTLRLSKEHEFTTARSRG